jgi:hypothetical protein
MSAITRQVKISRRSARRYQKLPHNHSFNPTRREQSFHDESFGAGWVPFAARRLIRALDCSRLATTNNSAKLRLKTYRKRLIKMADENIEKQMEFIIEQQAQFASKMGQLEDIVVRLAKATLDRFEATDERVDDIDKRISALVNSQVRTEENVKKTDENLRGLIAVVDRYFSEGRNGNSKG